MRISSVFKASSFKAVRLGGLFLFDEGDGPLVGMKVFRHADQQEEPPTYCLVVWPGRPGANGMLPGLYDQSVVENLSVISLPNGVIIPSQDINDLKFGAVQNQPNRVT